MNDFLSVVDFFFSVLGSLWSVITSSFILSFCVLVTIMGSVVYLVQSARGDK